MIHIEESLIDKKKVLIEVEGRLDRESLPTFRNVYLQHVEAGRSIHLDLSGLYHIGMQGRDFLLSIKGKVKLIGMNQYLKRLME